jgi:hypothetical protein
MLLIGYHALNARQDMKKECQSQCCQWLHVMCTECIDKPAIDNL